MAQQDPSQPVDKQYLYGTYLQSAAAREKFQRELAHMAVDLPVSSGDDVEIQSTRNVTYQGSSSGFVETVLLAAIAGGLLGWLGYLALRPTQSAPPSTPPAARDRDTRYDPNWTKPTAAPWRQSLKQAPGGHRIRT